MNPQERINVLKHQLYSALLQKPDKLWTDNEVDIAYALSKDESIQATLTEADRLMKEKEGK